MNADYLKKALDLVPGTAEVFVTEEDTDEEIPIGKFRYFPTEKVVWLILEPPMDEGEDEEEDENEGDTSELGDQEIEALPPAPLRELEAAKEPPAAVIVIDGAAPDCNVPRTIFDRRNRPPLIIDAEYNVLEEEPIRKYPQGEPAINFPEENTNGEAAKQEP